MYNKFIEKKELIERNIICMKENLKIFLISGKARHGKTTTGNMIKTFYKQKGHKSVLTSFGKYIKMFVTEISDWDGNPDTKPRTLLQELGTEVIRVKLGMNEFFVKRLEEDIKVYSEYVDTIIIDDVRLPIEMDYYKEKYAKNIICIHIDRPNFKSDLNAKELQHVTEVQLDNYTDYDYTIINDGTLEDLNSKVMNIINEVENK